MSDFIPNRQHNSAVLDAIKDDRPYSYLVYRDHWITYNDDHIDEIISAILEDYSNN